MEKTVIVIGGTGGIGFAISKKIYELGFTVYLLGRKKDEAKKKAKEIGKVFSDQMNVLEEIEVSGVFRKIISKQKRIYAVINLAGLFEPFGNFEKVKLIQHRKVIEVNLFGNFNVIHKILPIFKKQKFGKIILFSGGGVGGDSPLVNASSYYTSKAAISVLTEVLSKELENSNIQINAILPGQILTKSTKKTFKVSREKLGPVLGPATENLLKTGGNSVDNVLNLIEFLLSEESNHISGRTLSAKWDKLGILKNNLDDSKFKLRRIDGSIYKLNNKSS